MSHRTLKQVLVTVHAGAICGIALWAISSTLLLNLEIPEAWRVCLLSITLGAGATLLMIAANIGITAHEIMQERRRERRRREKPKT